MTRGSDSPQSGGQRPLEGIRVLDFTRVLSGPHATRMLSDLGAEVIKVEPPMGDMTRFAMPRVNSLSSYFIQQNVGKKNISLDMTKPQAVELLKKLVSHCDVVIENFRPLLAHVPTVCLPTRQHCAIFQPRVGVAKVGFQSRHSLEQFLPTPS